MSLAQLSERERMVVGQCLACVASGQVIADDWEFHTIFGIEFSELQAVAAAWPNVEESSDVVRSAINGSFANLLWYPHGKVDVLLRYVPVSLLELERIYSRWRGEATTEYFDGFG